MTVSRTVLIFAVSISVFWGGVAPVFGQQGHKGLEVLEALSKRFLSQIEALNAGKLDAAVAAAYEDIVVYGLYSPFPIEGKDVDFVLAWLYEIAKCTIVPAKSTKR